MDLSTLLNESETKTPMTLDHAISVADANNRADPDWKYKVVRIESNKALAYVEVYDEDGYLLGKL